MWQGLRNALPAVGFGTSAQGRRYQAADMFVRTALAQEKSSPGTGIPK
jgi:hypothetical protein